MTGLSILGAAGPTTPTTAMAGMPGMSMGGGRAPAAPAMGAMSMGGRPPVDAHTILTDWSVSAFPIAVAVVLVAIAAWYLWSVRRFTQRGRRWSPGRTAAFLGALVAVELALGSSIASLSMDTFTAHVIQHLFLMVVAPPLAALGAPMTLLLQTSPRRTKTAALRALHSRPFAVVRNQVSVFFLYYLSMYAFFLSPLLGYAMDHMWLMDAINLAFLAGATLFWWPMVGVDPIPGGRMHPGFKLLNLLIGVPVESFLGLAIMMQSTPLASMYTLGSTHTGGAVLWIATEVATVAALGPIYLEWSRSDARSARRIDAAIAAGTYQPSVVDGGGPGDALRGLRRDSVGPVPGASGLEAVLDEVLEGRGVVGHRLGVVHAQLPPVVLRVDEGVAGVGDLIAVAVAARRVDERQRHPDGHLGLVDLGDSPGESDELRVEMVEPGPDHRRSVADRIGGHEHDRHPAAIGRRHLAQRGGGQGHVDRTDVGAVGVPEVDEGHPAGGGGGHVVGVPGRVGQGHGRLGHRPRQDRGPRVAERLLGRPGDLADRGDRSTPRVAGVEQPHPFPGGHGEDARGDRRDPPSGGPGAGSDGAGEVIGERRTVGIVRLRSGSATARHIGVVPGPRPGVPGPRPGVPGPRPGVPGRRRSIR